MSPVRVQRKRTKGWTSPLCSCGTGHTAVYVGRGSSWGNPWKVGDQLDTSAWTPRDDFDGMTQPAHMRQFEITPEIAVALYRAAIENDWAHEDYWPGIEGHDLMCWCPLDQSCHADVLLELANGGAS